MPWTDGQDMIKQSSLTKTYPHILNLECYHSFLQFLYKTNRTFIQSLTSLTTLAGMTASQTTDFPLPSIQFIAAGFLSVQ